MFKIKAISLIVLTTFIFSACELENPFAKEEETPIETVKTEKIARFIEKNIDKEDTFTLGEDKAEIIFTSTGTASASNTAHVIPQTSGEITEMKVEIGDSVNENTPLFTLGNSLSTTINAIQYQSALDSLNIAQQSQNLTAISAETTINAAQIGLAMTRDVYQNTLTTKINAKRIFEEQLKSVDLALETAEDNYEDVRDAYNDAKDALEDAEDSGITEAIIAAEARLEGAKMAKDNARFGAEQAENSIGQIEENYYAQVDQLDFAIESAYTQEKSAETQLIAAQNATTQQELGAINQVLQAEMAAQIARVNADINTVKAPISGIVTEILVKEGNFVNPGQAVIKISQTDTLLIKTQINQSEARLITVGSEVELENDNGTTTGLITSINPTLNQMTKKVELEIETGANSKIVSGDFLRVNFSPKIRKQIFIPLNSIFIKEGKKFVRVITSKNEIDHKEITVADIMGEFAKIQSGLDGDETIVKASTTFLDEGDKVKIASK